MKLKIMDLVFCPKSKQKGQIHRIRNNGVLLLFVVGDRISTDLDKIMWEEDHWRING